jgi:recombination protein RecA
MTTKAEIDGEMGDNHVGQLARLMSQAMRKLTSVVSKTGCVAIFINQIREKIGVMYGNPETTPGGRALKFYASVRMDVRKGEVIKDNGMPIGNRMKVKVVKNKVAPPFRECEFDNIYGKGISRDGEVLDLAVELDIIKKSGSWFSYNGQKLGQGRDNVKQQLMENEEFRKEVEAKILEQIDQLDLTSVETDEEQGAADAKEVLEQTPAPVLSGEDIGADDDFEEFDPA